MASEIITFAISKLGASHLTNDKPCQDYSLSWVSQSGDARLVVVCDGHGGNTYVRSDVGARLAAEVTRDILINFVEQTDPAVFANAKGVVTARPDNIDAVLDTPKKSVSAMTEIERLTYNQNLLFCKQVSHIQAQDEVFTALFKSIYERWTEAITADRNENPFTKTEKEKLGNHRLAKAYGTTLQAFVRTNDYWFAFHIGDGRILAADDQLNWSQPVPWDCNCFQNVTTSLCSINPLPSFRYAFDGTGSFPAAVICCSDGIEDSYGDFDLAPDYLCNFYTGIVNVFLKEGRGATMIKLNEFLPKLSAAGSKDDMSMAGVIDATSLQGIVDDCSVNQ